MYAHFLSCALNEWAGDLKGDALFVHAQECRAEMRRKDRDRVSVAGLVATEVAYDRALIKLAEEHGIDITPSRFSCPKEERARLEDELAAAGFDVAGIDANGAQRAGTARRQLEP